MYETKVMVLTKKRYWQPVVNWFHIHDTSGVPTYRQVEPQKWLIK